MKVTIWYTSKEETIHTRRWYQFWKPKTWTIIEYPIHHTEDIELNESYNYIAVDSNIYSIIRITTDIIPN